MAKPVRTQYFYFDGEDSRSYGIYMENPIEISGAEPILETVQIPGRSGALLLYDGSYENVSFQADCFIVGKHPDAALRAIADWTVGAKGYRRLELPWEDGYRMAYITNGPETLLKARRLRPFSIQFACKPQVFTYDGELPVAMTKSGSLWNWGMTALPLVKVYGNGSGTVTIGTRTVVLGGIESYVMLDCEIQDAYKGSTNKNSTISAPEFPELAPGENRVSFTGGVTKLEITPRWWHL